MSGRIFYWISVVFSVVAIFVSNPAFAQDLEPRKYVNYPVDQDVFRTAIGYSTGEVDISPGIPIEDADLDMVGGSFAWLRTMGIGGKSSSLDAYLAYICAEGSAAIEGTARSRNTCGQGDARLRFTYNFIGAPALELGDFVKAEKQIVVGASVQVSIPIGAYDEAELLNIGANRWVIRPEIGMSVPAGKWNFEFSAGVRFFQDNDEFLGDSTSSQDPLYNLQAHVVYDLSPRQWLSLNGNYFFGGETYRNGNPTLLQQKNSRLGVTWHIALNSTNLFQLTLNSGVINRVGNDSTTISFAWMYRRN